MTETTETTTKKLVYAAPGLNLISLTDAKGACESGSANTICNAGNGASMTCMNTGNSAASSCSATGNAATSSCADGVGF